MKTKRLLSWFLALSMALTLLPGTALAKYQAVGGPDNPDRAELSAPQSGQTPEEDARNYVPAEQTTGQEVSVREAGKEKPAPEKALLMDAEDGSVEGGESDFYARFASAPVLTLGTAVTVEYDGTEASGAFRFTPSESGEYEFFSQGDRDTYVNLYDADGNYLASNDDDGEGNNFLLYATLEAGKNYVLQSRLYGGDSGTYTVTARKTMGVTALSLAVKSDAGPLLIGDNNLGRWSEYYDYDTGESVPYFYFYYEAICSALAITVTYEDGTTEEVSYNSRTMSCDYDCQKWTAGGADNTVTVTWKGTVSATANLPLTTMGRQYAGAPALTPGTAASVSYNGTANSGALWFTPERDGRYHIYSQGDQDPCVTVYSAEGRWLWDAYYGGEGSNFLLEAKLEAGKTYLLLTRLYDETATGAYTVMAERKPDITKLSLSLAEGYDPLVIGQNNMGYWERDYSREESEGQEYFRFDSYRVMERIAVTAGFEDGTSSSLSYNSELLEWEFDSRTWTAGGTANTVTVKSGEVSASINMPVNSYDTLFRDAPALALDRPQTVSFAGSDTLPLTFTPAADGTYYFYSDESVDTWAELRDWNGSSLGEADDSGSSTAFAIEAELKAGKTYILLTRTYDRTEASYAVTVSRTRPAIAAGYHALEGLDLSGKLINLVFVVDTTGSMGWVIDNVRNTLNEFVDALSATKATLRLALIDYKDIMDDGPGTTVVHPKDSSRSKWYENGELDLLHAEIDTLRADGGGDTPESVLDAFGNVVDENIIRFNRYNAAKFAFLLTDADYKEENNHGLKDMADLVSHLKEMGIATSVITNKSNYSYYTSMAKDTGGVLINLEGDFSLGMGAFAASIASSTEDYQKEDGTVPVTGVSFAEDLSVPVGKVQNFTAVVTPYNATNHGIEVETKDAAIAEIVSAEAVDPEHPESGTLVVVKGKAAGTTQIVVHSMDGDYTDSFGLTVEDTVITQDTAATCNIESLVTHAKSDASDAAKELVYYYADAAGEEGSVPEEVQKDIYDAIKDTGKSVTFACDDDKGDMKYQWSFDGADIEDPTIPVNMEISTGDASPADAPAREELEEYQVVNFSHEGALPGKATIQLPVNIRDGVYDLYYFNPATNKLEKAGGAVVKDGIATFTIEHCSSYVIGTTEKKLSLSLEVKDAAETVVTVVPDGAYTVNVTVDGGTLDAAAVVYVASYDADGRFVSAGSADLSAGGTAAAVSMSNSGKAVSLRSFLLNSPTDAQPLGTAGAFPNP